MTQNGSLAELLGAVVLVGTIRVGEVQGIFVDETGSSAIGLEVAGTGGIRRFLPWVAATRHEGGVSIASALLLVDDGASYERLGARTVRDAEALNVLRASPEGALAGTSTVSDGALAGTRRG